MIISKIVSINKPTGKYFKYYKDLGYNLSSEIVEVEINHLSLGSKYKIEVSCDYCGFIKKIPYCDYNKTTKNNTLKYACKDCGSLKQKDLCLEKYGVSNPFEIESVKNKIKGTNLERYGVDNYTKTDEYKEKTKKTNLEKWGVEYFQSTNEWKQKIKEIILLKYKVDHISKSEEVRKIYSIGKNENYIKYLSNRFSLFKCDEYDHEFEISYDNYKSRLINNVKLCTVCNPIGDSQSIKEGELFNWIKSIYNGKIIQSYRDGMEIDIYLPELKIGFEFNGLHWHSEKYKDKWYHLKKTNYFKERGIRIVHIWEDDWDIRCDIIKSKILNILGLSHKIYARNCNVSIIDDFKIVRDFLKKNHIQGDYLGIKKSIGLFYNDELVSIMTFDQFEGRKKMEPGGWNLSRFCNKLNYSVVGGASKILLHFVNIYKPSRIISYADKDWSTGNLYDKLEFLKLYETRPDYKYIINNNRCHKSSYRKSKTGISESKLNIYKLWDCGKIKYEKII